MGAVAYRVRRRLRQRPGTTVVLTLVVAAACGAVILFVAGADRTATAPDRYTRSLGGLPDATVTQDRGPPQAALVSALPSVSSATSWTFVFGGLRTSGPDPRDADGGIFAGTPEALGLRLVHGRAPRDAHEFVASSTFVAGGQHAIGDRFELSTYTQAQADAQGFGQESPAGPTLTATLVGVVDGPPALDDPTPAAVFPPELLGEGDVGVARSGIAVHLRDGADIAQLRAEMDADPTLAPFGVDDARIISVQLRRAVDAQARAVWLLAAVAALGTVVALTQVLSRHVRLRGDERRTLAALGVTRAQIVGESLAGAALVVVVGTVLGAVAAIAASPLFPIDFVRRIEPDPGVLVNTGLVVATVAGLIAVLLLALGASLALTRPPRAARPSPAVEAIAAHAPSAPAATGLRAAFGRFGLERASVPASVGGMLLAVTGMVAAVTFGVSLDRLVTEPDRYGVTFDASLNDSGAERLGDELANQLIADENLSTVVFWAPDDVRVGATTLPLLAMRVIRGDQLPPVLTGRLPIGDNEIALGRLSAARLGAHVGGELTLTGPTGDHVYRVIGLAVLPDIDALDGVGEGALITVDGLSHIDAGAPTNLATVSFRSRAAAQATYRELAGPSALSKPAAIVNVARVRAVPFILAAVLAALAALTLVHLTVTAVRARRRDLAVLSALGADGRWISRVVHWQATAFVALPLLVGVPLGLAVGRLIFVGFADAMGAVNAPAWPWLAVLAIVAGGLVLANLVAAVPARRIPRLPPSVLLHAE